MAQMFDRMPQTRGDVAALAAVGFRLAHRLVDTPQQPFVLFQRLQQLLARLNEPLGMTQAAAQLGYLLEVMFEDRFLVQAHRVARLVRR